MKWYSHRMPRAGVSDSVSGKHPSCCFVECTHASCVITQAAYWGRGQPSHGYHTSCCGQSLLLSPTCIEGFARAIGWLLAASGHHTACVATWRLLHAAQRRRNTRLLLAGQQTLTRGCLRRLTWRWFSRLLTSRPQAALVQKTMVKGQMQTVLLRMALHATSEVGSLDDWGQETRPSILRKMLVHAAN